MPSPAPAPACSCRSSSPQSDSPRFNLYERAVGAAICDSLCRQGPIETVKVLSEALDEIDAAVLAADARRLYVAVQAARHAVAGLVAANGYCESEGEGNDPAAGSAD